MKIFQRPQNFENTHDCVIILLILALYVSILNMAEEKQEYDENDPPLWSCGEPDSFAKMTMKTRLPSFEMHYYFNVGFVPHKHCKQ